jgi:NitT/TauT family transport system substrate-binding protein
VWFLRSREIRLPAGQQPDALDDPQMKSIRLRLLWYPQAQFAGYLVAERLHLGATHNVELVCVPPDLVRGTVDAVLAGESEFAVASPSHMLESATPDDLVLLLAIQQESSLVYPARRSDGIARATDLAGHRVAVWAGEDLELRWMLQRAGVATNAVVRVQVQGTVDALLSGDVSCAQMTSYHELHVLETAMAHAGGALDEFVLLRAADFSAALLKDGLIARRDWVEAHPVETQAVIDAVLAGWTRSFDDVATAIAICELARPDMAHEEHRLQLQEIKRLSIHGSTLTHGLGYPDIAHIIRAATALAEVDGNHPVSDPAHLIDNRFWARAPAGCRRTAW